MALILSLETSTTVCSVAVHMDGKIVATSEVHKPQSHAAKLANLVEEILNIAEVHPTQLNAIAIASGPGSYTGLRIGTSIAKGLCYALDIPLIAVNTLDLLASQVKSYVTEDVFLCPMIDARRMEVYCHVIDSALNIKQGVKAKVIDETSFLEFLNRKKVFFFGDGALKCRNIIQHPNAIFFDNIFPAAAYLGLMAHQKYVRQDTEDLQHFEPFYLKEFIAKKPMLNP
ncbi:MAG: tRNA (adenosine(37)-N6)-threonylcarbamoyltransferase complex dimerization subunit type 1 TsaB [Cyclobacteriaceae bacterium]|nr:tRNA (adenosine(37)-N6)-threonylcarbamoyltransferase complex dimerization subunit type 1 TsaB [Cyclobacteriaceae bacterium]